MKKYLALALAAVTLTGCASTQPTESRPTWDSDVEVIASVEHAWNYTLSEAVKAQTCYEFRTMPEVTVSNFQYGLSLTIPDDMPMPSNAAVREALNRVC